MNRINITADGVNVRRAFTLIELIVVVGIVGILAGIVITSFSGGMEAARSVKCISNMRSLAHGATVHSMDLSAGERSSPYLPYAGSYISSSGMDIAVGWIRWLDMDSRDKEKPEPCDNINACCKDDYKAFYAITNGTLWKFVNRDMKTYVCPEHEARALKYNAKPRFSYVMSAWFYYDKTIGGTRDAYAWDTGKTGRWK